MSDSYESLWWLKYIPKLQTEIEDINGLLTKGATWGRVRKQLLQRKAVLLGELANAQLAAEAHAQLDRKAPENVAESSPVQNSDKTARLQRGKRCAQFVEEVKRFKHQRVDIGKTVFEIQSENPNLLIWKVRENLSLDDRELFDHPNRWESVSYAYGLLGKEYAKSWMTIRD